MALKCVQVDGQWGVAHTCDADGCEAHSPPVFGLVAPVDTVEIPTLPSHLHCPRDGTCQGAQAGWHIGENDFCPAHKGVVRPTPSSGTVGLG
jgi:hypothetical protein